MKKLFIILISTLSLVSFTQADNLTRLISYELGKVEGSIPQINMLIKKGGDTRNYEYAAKEAYQEIISEITSIIKEQITK